MNYVIVIPARLNSTRLPRKPLINIHGKPMILRTFEQCLKAAERSKIYVTTDSEEIVQLCIENDIQYLKTSSSCLTGTDRVVEFSKKIDSEIYINVQGDEPVFNPEDILKIITETNKTNYQVCNGYTAILDNSDYFSRSRPKVVFNANKELMYMSRAPIPHSKDGAFNEGYKQVCIYSFTKKALSEFGKANRKTRFEKIEDIEILRFLELGIKVKMVELSDMSIPVDNPVDLQKVKDFLLINNSI